jgi:NAD(P)-dependent dehydrogenase (short-subunit alcohol dehydrogenase family)
MNTNLRGVWLSMKAEILQMRKQGSGVIVNTASVQGLAANPGFTAYTASKHGILGLTKTAALENASANIRVNAVAPGPIDTAMTERTLNGDTAIRRQLENRVPVKRIGRAEEVARAVLWLASDESPFVTGTFLTIDGGIIAQE